MKRRFFFAVVLSLLFSLSAQAVSFDSGIKTGVYKKYSILTEHFRIEFSELVKNQTDSDGDKVADVIEKVAEAAEESWDEEIDGLGFDRPVPSGERLLIIIDDTEEYVGDAVGITSILSDGVTPFMAVHPWIGDDLIEVTVAHEFFHTIQMAHEYDFLWSSAGINFAEMTAVWMEDYIFDSINDYVNYLPDFFSYPDYSVFASQIPEDTLYQYGSMIWPRFLTEYYGKSSIIRELVETYFDLDSDYDLRTYDVFETVIDDEGDSLVDLFQEFTLWNLAPDEEDYYTEGRNYPDVWEITDLTYGEYTLIDSSEAPALYGTNYLYFENTDAEHDFYFHLIKPDGVGFMVTLVPDINGSLYTLNPEQVIIQPDEVMEEELYVDNMKSRDGIYAVVSPFLEIDVDTADTDIFDYAFSYYYAGDFGASVKDGDGLNVDDSSDAKEGEELTSLSEDERGGDNFTLELSGWDGDSVSLQWSRSADKDTDSYEVRYGEKSETYYGSSSVASAHIVNKTISHLHEGTLYYFVVVALDENGDEVERTQELAVQVQDPLFSDILNTDSRADAIASLVDEGIFEGYDDGTFRPENAINRAELLKILVEASYGLPNPDVYKNCFPDVSEEWFATYVCFAKEHGYVNGYPDNTFRPGDTVNKVEALKMMFNVFGEDLNEGQSVSGVPYADVPKNAWFSIYVWHASQLGILSESVQGDFSGAEGRTRGAISLELYRYLQLD